SILAERLRRSRRPPARSVDLSSPIPTVSELCALAGFVLLSSASGSSPSIASVPERVRTLFFRHTFRPLLPPPLFPFPTPSAPLCAFGAFPAWPPWPPFARWSRVQRP